MLARNGQSVAHDVGSGLRPGQHAAAPTTYPLVSVVIATYNCAQYVGEAIESVLAQTYPHFELHVVNDGSTDRTADVVARYRRDPRVHYHEQANAGQTAAKNRGIQASRGELVAFCDADDRWLPDKLARQVPEFGAGERVGVVYSRSAQITAEGERIESSCAVSGRDSARMTEDLFLSNIIPFGTAMVRRGCLHEMGGFDERYRMGIDWELWLRLSTRYEFRFVDEVTYLYRVWPGQMSRNWRGRYEAAFRIMGDFLDQHPGLLSSAVVRTAFADSYVRRARLRAVHASDYTRALLDLGRALRLRPTMRFAWKSVGYVLLAAAGRREP